MERHDYITCIGADAERVAAAARLDLNAVVPACAPWTLSDLVMHLGRINRWATGIVLAGTTDAPTGFPPRPGEGADLADWYSEGAAGLIAALETADPEAPAYNFIQRPELVPLTNAFWFRRQAHETAMHRADAQSANGEIEPIDAALAVDGIEELLFLFAPHSTKPGEGETVHLHATDVEGEWLVRFAPSGIEVERGHSKGDVALKGTASDLLLFVWNRIPAERLEIHGDASIAALWPTLLTI